jgi:class 3 adenylate cyclase
LSFSLSTLAQELPDSIDLRIQEIPVPETNEKQKLKDKIRNLGISKSFKKTKSNVALTVALQQARLSESQEQFLTAIHHYQKVVDLYSAQGDVQEVTNYLQHMALLYHKAGRTQQALDQYELVLERKEASGDTTNLVEIRKQLKNLIPSQTVELAQAEKDPELVKVAEEMSKQESDRLKSLAESTERGQDYKRSLEYYKLYTELTTKQKEAEQAQQLALQEKTFELERQAQQMKLLESEKEVQSLTLSQQQEQLVKDRTFKRNLLIGTLLLTLAVIATFFMYRGKRKALTGLGLAYQELNATKDKLVSAEEKLKNLLDQQLSRGVAIQLMDHDKADKAQKKFVCIMFLDIRGFTPFAERLEPEELIQYQNDVFGLMIDIVDKHQGVINQFLGDGFMATFGLQEEQSSVCDEALEAAIEIITIVNQKSASGAIPNTKVGIGLHAGNVVTGNVGTSIRKQYSVTGNTVIMASRIEQLNKHFKSQLLISREVHQQLSKPESLPKDFMNVEVKGRKRPVELLKIA